MSEAVSHADAAPTPTPQIGGQGGDVIGSLSDAQRSHWRMTGELPDASHDDAASKNSQTPKPASSPGEPDVQAAETAAHHPPASEPGTPKKNNASTRKSEIQADIEELETLLRRRHELRSQLEAPPSTPQPVSDPATTRPGPATLADTLSNPDVNAAAFTETQFWEKFPDATVGDYARYVARYELRADAHAREQLTQREGRLTPFREQEKAVLAERPDFWSHIDPRIASLKPIDTLPAGVAPTVENVIAQEILTSPVAMKLVEHFSQNADVLLAKLRSLPNYAAVIREIGRLESKLETSAVPPVVKETASPVSLAPEPTPTLGRKAKQPADELDDAIRTGDFARYRELQNRKEMRSA